MSYTTGTFREVAAFDGRVFAHGNFRRFAVGAVVIGLGTLVAAWVIAGCLTMAAAWVIAASLASDPNIQAKAPISPKFLVRANPYGTLAGVADFSGSARVLAEPGHAPGLTPRAKLPARVEPTPAARASAAPLPPRREFDAQNTPLPPPRPVYRPQIQAKHEIAHALNVTLDAELTPAAAPTAAPASVVPLPPLPPERVHERARNARSPQQERPWVRPYIHAKQETGRPQLRRAAPQAAAVAPPPPASTPFSFFQKLFSPQPGYDNSNSPPAAANGAAIYDIASHMVYLPDGERLEAHSGLGAMIDNPRYVNQKDRGATPPHVYDLTLRRRLFHGVRAMRLNPVGGGNMFGRTGLLAHSYMLGPNGQSNGCVSFRNYPKFLQAYMKGEIRRLVVVTHLGAGSSPVTIAGRQPRYQYASNTR